MTRPVRGLYETLVSEALAARLADVAPSLDEEQHPLRSAEAADRIAFHVSRVVQQALESVPDKERVGMGIALARRLVAEIQAQLTLPGTADEAPTLPGSVLHKLLARSPDHSPEQIESPLIPLLDTALLTNAPGEPRVGRQLLAEIQSADRVDVVMAFIRRSGIRGLHDALSRHCKEGRSLRVLTTTYTGSTEARALDMLRDLGADVRVSYETDSTRLHAKAWLFHRNSGFSTAYIGSSNLTHSAQVTGLEWNVRVSGARNPDVITKVGAVFESYWNGGDFVPYDPEQFATQNERSGAGKAPTILLSPLEVRLEPFQARLLDQIELARRQGHHRNLLVSATGTGKTVMAAVDYGRLRDSSQRTRLLFVAHREEILDQSLATFRQVLRDHSFGERWVGAHRPRAFEHVFASIQSLTASGLVDLNPEHFDVVIIDEVHHAAAPSYRRLLEHIRPRELLCLTATPERSDGLSILEWFEGRIAAELRLWDAIDQHRLAPFHYFGISDGVDLRAVPWRRGRGYDVESLSNVYTGNDAWARKVIKEVASHIDEPETMRALGYCVSVDHARFMARSFRDANIPAVAVWGNSPDQERRAALSRLASGDLRVVFSVDLFNEGIDVPNIDTLLMLRPTESPTLFLQQLGRGLRLSPGKTACTVLDFIGHHRTEFRFDRRYRALLGGSRKSLEQQIHGGFPFLPAGCHLELDAQATNVVLRSVRQSVPTGWTAKVDELRRLATDGKRVSFDRYLDETGLEVDDVYVGGKSWSDLCTDAGLPTLDAGPHEVMLRRACGRMLHVDDDVRLTAYRRLLASDDAPSLASISERDRRLLRMLVASVAGSVLTKSDHVSDAVGLLWRHAQVRSELCELLDVLAQRIDHLHSPLASHPAVPLQVHARYSRIEILAAMMSGDAARIPPWQTGVYWCREAAADLLAFTLDKTSGEFSPSTRYRDFAISRDLIHWESQSITRADSETGTRYQQHRLRGSAIFLFARLRADDRAFWFLGPADYVSHESEQPMAITWRLHTPLPGDLFAEFAAAVA